MPLVTDLLEDLDKYRWYCSLDMASGFWVVPMTDRAPGSVLGRRSYIDDILIGGTTWDDLCQKVERLLELCEEWNLSISVEKSEWGMSKVDYLGHEVSEDGLGAKPKNLETLATLEFRSFLGSLNYYHRFIPDFAIYAAALYSLSARDFEERVWSPETRDLDKWGSTRSQDRDYTYVEPVVIVYASDWAVSAVLAQDHDGVYLPVKFTSRTLKPNELNYSIAEKEILALLRVLNECHNMLAGRTIRVLTRHTTLGWLFRSKGTTFAMGSSPWRLAILRSVKGEEEILGALAASITPRAYVDAALEEIAPRKRPSRTAPIPVPKIGPTESLHVISFDGSARVKREGGAFSAVIWKLPNNPSSEDRTDRKPARD
ncbi:LOW QUALITY PROTEIN: reverse transcriptase [Phytophthora megakarya]|uniref:Reverse transcriptase n=1 Tax=Phytophthora megakarya TaxID=4795 RepID=A0A225UJ10_9STRA|nr:LOW QUALITY PROTEIN: reverse transcriptase [Phytophthora megakarya]